MSSAAFSGIGPLTTTQTPAPSGALVAFSGMGAVSTQADPSASPPITRLSGTGPVTTTTAPSTSSSLTQFTGVGPVSYAVRQAVNTWFTFMVFPPPELHDVMAAGVDNIALVPLSLTNHNLALEPTPNHVSIKFNDLITVSDVPPYLPKRDYYFEFGVEPTAIRIPYVFDFDVLAKATEGDFEFTVQAANRTRITYDQWFFNIILTDKPYVSYLFAFDVEQPRLTYDFEFNVTQSLTSYDFSFIVASQVKQTVDFELDVVESWVPVTLVCSATPLFPGLISPSARKHRLNIRVYAGSILVGAGYAYYLWNGAGNARVRFTIEGIPQLSADHRVIVYDNIVKVYDETIPYSEFWSDSYGNS